MAEGGSITVEVDKDKCYICREAINEAEKQTTSCLHSFHKLCIRTWLQEHVSCPVCKTTLDQPLIHSFPDPTSQNTPEDRFLRFVRDATIDYEGPNTRSRRNVVESVSGNHNTKTPHYKKRKRNNNVSNVRQNTEEDRLTLDVSQIQDMINSTVNRNHQTLISQLQRDMSQMIVNTVQECLANANQLEPSANRNPPTRLPSSEPIWPTEISFNPNTQGNQSPDQNVNTNIRTPSRSSSMKSDVVAKTINNWRIIFVRLPQIARRGPKIS